MKGARALPVLALALCGCALSHNAATLTKLEVRRLPQADATARVLDQADDLLSRRSALPDAEKQAILFRLFRIVADDPSTLTPRSAHSDEEIRGALDRLAATARFVPDPMAGRHPQYRLREYTLETPYRASPYAGLCVSAAFTVLFDAAGAAHGPATPVRASGAASSFQYHLLDGRVERVARKASPAEHARAQSDCAKLDPDSDADGFYAPDDRDAVEVTWLMRAAIAAAADPHPAFAFDCEKVERAKCLSALSQAKPVATSVSACEPAEGGHRQCTTDSSGTNMDITLDDADPPHILRVRVYETIVIADYAAD